MTKLNRCFLSIFLVFFIIVSISAVQINDTNTAYAESTFDTSNVVNDLLTFNIDNKPFAVEDYPFVDGGKCKVIYFYEYRYSSKVTLRGDYGLYVYVYNPSSLNIDTGNVHNKIQLAVAFNENGKATDYENFSLSFCGKTTNAEDKSLFYKFKIVDHKSADGKTILQRVSSSKRLYAMSGIELVTVGDFNAIDYPVAVTYTYTGFSTGYGLDATAASDLQCAIADLETISLNVQHTSYRTGISNLGVGHQNQLNSVYFAVNNHFVNDYGNLQKVKAEWEKYKTSPIVVTEDTTMYAKLINYVGTILGDDYSSAAKYTLYNNFGFTSVPSGSGSISVESADWCYNPKDTVLCEDVSYLLSYLFYTSEIDDYTLSGNALKEYMQGCAIGASGVLDGTVYNADLFERIEGDGYVMKELDADDDEFNMLSYDTAFSKWQKFLDYGFWAAIVDTDESHYGISPIYQVKATDLLFTDELLSSSLLIDLDDIPDFRSYCAEAIENNETVCLFRYDVSDYYSSPLRVTNNAVIPDVDSDTSFLAEQFVYLNFNIIQLTFLKNSVYTVVPVVQYPIDVIPDVTAPIDDPDIEDVLENIGGKIEDLFDNVGNKIGGVSWAWLKWVAIAVAVVVGILLLILFFPILKLLIKVLVLPFEAIANAIRKQSKKNKYVQKNKVKKKEIGKSF